MNQEDLKNLTGWLQAIFKEAQESRGAAIEMRDKVNMIPEIRDHSMRGGQDSSDAERKIDEARTHLEARIDKLEGLIREISNNIHDIQSKVNHLK